MLNVDTAIPAAKNSMRPPERGLREAGVTGLEPATSGLTVLRSNQLSYTPERTGKADGRWRNRTAAPLLVRQVL